MGVVCIIWHIHGRKALYLLIFDIVAMYDDLNLYIYSSIIASVFRHCSQRAFSNHMHATLRGLVHITKGTLQNIASKIP